MRAFTPVNPGGFHVQRMRGGFQPIPYQQSYRGPEMGQIQINPNIQAPINIGLGTLPLTIGLFTGSAVSLLMGSQIPTIRNVTSILALGLAGAGVLNLILPKDTPAVGGPVTTTPVTPGQSSGPIAPSVEEAFSLVSGRILSPGYGDTIDVSPFGTPSVPMRVRLTNDGQADASFDLVISSDEQPEPFGARVTNSQTMRVYIPKGETRDIDVSVGVSSWEALTDYVEVDVVVSKRRIDGGNRENLAGVLFVVE